MTEALNSLEFEVKGSTWSGMSSVARKVIQEFFAPEDPPKWATVTLAVRPDTDFNPPITWVGDVTVTWWSAVQENPLTVDRPNPSRGQR